MKILQYRYLVHGRMTAGDCHAVSPGVSGREDRLLLTVTLLLHSVKYLTVMVVLPVESIAVHEQESASTSGLYCGEQLACHL